MQRSPAPCRASREVSGPRRHAADMVYADGIDLTAAGGAVPIGVGCRICPRRECGQRAHPAADHRFEANDSQRMENLYMG